MLALVPPALPIEGGGATTAVPSDDPAPLRVPRGFPPALFPVPEFDPPLTDGGGGMTFAASEGALPVPLEALLPFTLGGGGTTSAVPNNFPIRLLTNDPLPCCGGGGITAFVGSAAVPLARRRISDERLAEGGGATTVGAGSVNRDVRSEARCGADTGGGTTEGLVICMSELES